MNSQQMVSVCRGFKRQRRGARQNHLVTAPAFFFFGMNTKSFKPLEFDKIRERLAKHTAFGPSRELAQSLAPSSDPAQIQVGQKETTEARALLDQHPGLSVGGARDVRPVTHSASIGGLLNPADFLDVRATLLSARNLKRHLIRRDELYPRLTSIAGGLNDVSPLVDAIGQVLNDQGEVIDSASPELARIRRELNVARGRMTERLQKMIGSSQLAKYLQEPIITQRDGRYVIPVRAEARGRVNGIVHDASASGATLFIEPLAVVELGNRVRELQIQETREVERILRELTNLVAMHAVELDFTVETLGQLDLLFAKAKYAAELAATEALFDLSANSYLEIKKARHPLLDPERAVPISLELKRSFSILIITGPNTGGKTVTLKTVGLLVLMAQSGLHIPAEPGVRLPIFDGVYADIGDEQSIEQSLSTFSAHLTNIVEILGEADANSLVLFDELGAGTDPVEGSALARAIIENLRARKIPALVATHFAELKAFAHSTPDVENASMEFDVETLAPTFRLTIGLPGRSNAFAIASRLGLDPTIIADARDNVGSKNAELETMLAEIKHAQEETAREQSRAAAERESAQRVSAMARRELQETERQRGEILRRTREEAATELEAARAELKRLTLEWRSGGLNRDAVKQAESDLDALEEATDALHPAPAELERRTASQAGDLSVGDEVFVPGLNQTGQVVGVGAGGVDVQIGSFRTHLEKDRVELRGRPARGSEESSTTVVLPSPDSPGIEVHLRGMRAEDALDKLDKYLDRAYLAGLPFVRVVHGKGTGTLRKLAREHLASSPLVVSYQTAEPSEGGEGVTVAKMASR